MTEAKKKPSRTLGIDFGLARIGLAISDERRIFATAASTIVASKKMEKTVDLVLEEMNHLQQKWDCIFDEIVIGHPLKMGGQHSFMTDEAECFMQQLQQRIPNIPVLLWDERLTSVQAERSLVEAGLSRKKRSKVIDVISAVLILQGFLDRKNLYKNDFL